MADTGTMTVASTAGGVVQPVINAKDLIYQHTLSWISDSSGNVSKATPALMGTLLGVEFNPSASAAPTTLYDITLTDPNGVDILSGIGANLPSSGATKKCPGVVFTDGTSTSTMPQTFNGTMTLVVANAGNVKAGDVILNVKLP